MMEITDILIVVISSIMGGIVVYLFMSKLLQTEKKERADDKSMYENRICTLKEEKKGSLKDAKLEEEKKN
jgi:anaerobic C4-dicarboxylate transporter